MNITFSFKNISINSRQKEYIEKKIKHLSNLLNKIKDSSSRVDINITKTKAPVKNIQFEVNITVPNKLIRAEVLSNSPEEAIDLCEEKLKVQIEKYKAKFVINDMHSNKKIGMQKRNNKPVFTDLIE